MTTNQTIIDTQTGETTIKPLTKAELRIVEDTKIEHDNYLADIAAKASAKDALLERLGITAEEAKLLLS